MTAAQADVLLDAMKNMRKDLEVVMRGKAIDKATMEGKALELFKVSSGTSGCALLYLHASIP